MQPAPGATDLVGRTLMGKLRVDRVLGAGGMGTVYAVEHLITRHQRALKVLHPQHSQSHETVARFVREAGVAGTLRTPYVVETYDAGTLEDGAAYVLMERLSGQPLASLLERREPITPGRMVGIVCQVLEGLSVAHAAGIVHRDIKPDNLFLVRDEQGRERVKILDFGISKFTHGVADYAGTLTTEGTMMGTPYYMSPEQASGVKDVDARTDLYSLGVVLYEGVAGMRPFDGQTLAALVIRIHKGECTPLEALAPHLAPGLAALVEKAMSPAREQRFESAREMLAALIPFSDSSYVASLHTLREVAADAPTMQRAAMPLEDARRAREREVPDAAITIDAIALSEGARLRRSLVMAALAVMLVLGVGGAVAWSMRDESPLAVEEPAVREGVPSVDDGARTDDAVSSSPLDGAEDGADDGADEGASDEMGEVTPAVAAPPAPEPVPEPARIEPRVQPPRRDPPRAPRGPRTIERDNPY